MEVEFYDLGKVHKDNLKFAVISSVYQGKWIYVRHKERETCETPGGHLEIGESIDNTANRELFEETGAKEFTVKPICDYSVLDFKLNNSDEKSYGRLFFSEVTEIGALLMSEIIEVKLFDGLPENLTYPEIQPLL